VTFTLPNRHKKSFLVEVKEGTEEGRFWRKRLRTGLAREEW
jgi:hypothetical protein